MDTKEDGVKVEEKEKEKEGGGGGEGQVGVEGQKAEYVMEYVVTDYSLIDQYRVPKDPKTHFQSVFVPFQSSFDVFVVYLPRNKSDETIKEMFCSKSISKRYLAKRDESYVAIQEFGDRPKEVEYYNNTRAMNLIRTKREIFGNVILVHQTLDSFDEWGIYHDVTAPMYEKISTMISQPIFDFKNNLKKKTDYIEAICVLSDFKYPDGDTWTIDKLPHSILNEYLTTVGKSNFAPVKHEFDITGPFACLFQVDGLAFASLTYPQLKQAQSNLAHRLLRYFLAKQNSWLHNIPMPDIPTGYLEFTDEQEKYSRLKEERERSKQIKMMEIDTQDNQSNNNNNNNNNQTNVQQQQQDTSMTESNNDNNNIETQLSPKDGGGGGGGGHILVFDKFKIPEDSVVMTLGDDADSVVKYTMKLGRGDYPKFGSKVIVKYQTFLTDGTAIDEKLRQETYDIGITSSIRGLELALFNMKTTEKALLKIEPDYGYGKLGALPLVPPNSILIIYIEILDIQHKTTPAQQEIDTMEIVERLKAIEKYRRDGKHAFERRYYGKCLKIYKNALKHTTLTNLGTVTNEQWDMMHDHGTVVCVNLAISYSCMGIWDRCRDYCTMALTYNNENSSKPYYWRAKANTKLSQYDYALEDINTAISIGSSDEQTLKSFIKYRDYVQLHVDKQNASEAHTYRSIFENLGN